MQIELVEFSICSAWDSSTAFPMPTCDLLRNDRAIGQCAVSAVLLQDYFGGDIKKGIVNGQFKHYWNVIDGEKLDITASQFCPPITITNEKKASREKLLADSSFYRRYSILKSRVDVFIQRYQEIEAEIRACCLCEGFVEPFMGNTVFWGRRNDVILLGEAPAYNGWRKSGLAWRDANGDFIPSGKRLRDLLTMCGLNLLDCSFIETVKCYPLTRNKLKCAAHNCSIFIAKQIALLAPKIIVPLGKVATEVTLSTQAPFNELVGQAHNVQIGGHNVIVFPIYHPSPVSPKSWKDNALLMPKLKELLKNGDKYAE